LSCPVGTVLSRLSRARSRLSARLARRGLGPSAIGILAARAGETTSEAASAAWFQVTVEAATKVAAGDTIRAGAQAVTAIALAKEVARDMWMTRAKAAVFVMVALGIAGAADAWARQEPAGKVAEGATKPDPAQGAVPFNRLEVPRPTSSKRLVSTSTSFDSTYPKGRGSDWPSRSWQPRTSASGSCTTTTLRR
jgi:hypothetical protein